MRFHSALLVVCVMLLMTLGCGGGDGEGPTAPTYPVGKPTGVDATPGNRSATVTWNEVPGAVGYYVYISYDGIGFHRYAGGVIRGTSFSVFNLNNGQTYYFGVSAVGSGGWESSISYPGGAPTAKAVIPRPEVGPTDPNEGPPDPPRNLQGVAKDAACEIQWTASEAGDLDYYRIYRLTGPPTGLSIWPLVVDQWTQTMYRDDDLVNDQSYSYRITAVDTETPALESDPSNVVTLTPMDFPPEMLQNLSIYVNPGRILLEWDEPEEADITKYALERVEGKDPVSGAEIVTRFVINKPTGTLEDPDIYGEGLLMVYRDLERGIIVVQDMFVTVGVIYTYRVTAIDASNQEGPTAEITALIPVY